MIQFKVLRKHGNVFSIHLQDQFDGWFTNGDCYSFDEMMVNANTLLKCGAIEHHESIREEFSKNKVEITQTASHVVTIFVNGDIYKADKNRQNEMWRLYSKFDDLYNVKWNQIDAPTSLNSIIDALRKNTLNIT